MNLETRKLSFIQEILKIQSEKTISRLETILRKEKNTSKEQIFEPMTQNELDKRIDKSESDFKNNRFKSSSELLTKYD
jgi:hypothetical protein